jgi:hypothetical protein
MIEMFPLRDTKTGNSKEPDYEKAPIYIALPSGGHYSNYRNAVSKYFDNIRVVDDYYITVNKYGNYD